jgi:hypothetical protein
MSQASKETLSEIKKTFEALLWDVIDANHQAAHLGDMVLTKKLIIAQDSIEGVLSHLEHRSDGTI